MTSMFQSTTRSALAVAFAGLLAAAGPALASSGGGGGGGSSSGGGSGMQSPQTPTCKNGLVWSTAVQRCVKPRSSGLTDKELLQQGRAMALAGQYQDALDVLDAVDNKQDSMVLTYIGYSHRKMGQTDVGIGYYMQALAIDPRNINTHEYLGEGYVSSGKYELAKAELDTVKQLCGDTKCEQYEELAAAIAGKPVD